MQYFPAALENLTDQFARLPGIGGKTAQRLAFYVLGMPEQEALKKVEDVLDPKVIQLVGDDGAPMPVQSNVDGAKLAAFIDAAVADSIKELEKRDDDLSKAGVTMLGNVDGKSMVERMSPQFLEFVLDAYRSLKYTR